MRIYMQVLFHDTPHHKWELLGNYPVFAVIKIIPNFSYKIYDHEKYYPGELANMHI